MVRKSGALVLLAVACATGWLASGAAATTQTSCPNPDTPSALLQLPDFDYSVFCLINQRRAENGVKPLRPNGLLRDAANIYVTSLLSGQFFTHHGDVAGTNNKNTVIGRLKFLGYIPRGKRWIVGETLREARLPTDTPAQVVQAWMDSPIHRVELLKRKFEDLGVASGRGIADEFPTVTGVTVAAEFGFRRPPKKKRR